MNTVAYPVSGTGTSNTTPVTWRGGPGSLVAHAATWGTATVQLLADGTNWVPVSTALSADGKVDFDCPAGQIRVALSGITTLTGTLGSRT